MATAARFAKHAKTIGIGATVSSSFFLYVAYRTHDRRILTNDEVTAARQVLAQITPQSKHSTPPELSQRQQHLSNLKEMGVSVIKHVLSQSQLHDWNAKTKAVFENTDGRNYNIVWNNGRAHFCVSKRSAYYEDMTRIGGEVNANETTTERNALNQSTFFRWWLERLHLKKNVQVSEHNDSNKHTDSSSPVSLQEVVTSHFQHHNIPRYELTDVQFLNAYPNKSTNQIWHFDNKFKGLTAIVALKDIRGNGPTELILGSHCPDYSLRCRYWAFLKRYAPFLQASESEENDEDETILIKPLLACIDAGDAVLYDARIFHRGRGNTSFVQDYDNDRPVLVLRWDASRTPPHLELD
jgi:ectoine hydroxylase-related dioxygenase (phytanoyl-CoA dioxygenase family)